MTALQVPGLVRIDVKVRPAEIKGDDDKGWFTTVSGIQGDAVGVPSGYLPDWGAQTLPGLSPTGQTPGKLGAPGTIGSGGIGAPGALGSGGIGVQGGLGSPPPPAPPPPPAEPPTDPDSSQ